jgi:microcin C transport system permease protein
MPPAFSSSRLSPVMQRRLWTFRRNRRAVWSLALFLLLFTLCLFAEFVANDKPVMVWYDGDLYFPAVKTYSESTFGGDFDTEADYSDSYISDLIRQKGWLLWPIIPYAYDTHVQNLPGPAPTPPSMQNWLGTDDQARDVVARLIYGFRTSVLFALVLTFASTIIGVAVGAMQGFYGGNIDLFGQRFLEIWGGMPVLFILLILSSLVTPNFWWLLGIMLLFSWTALVGYVRAEFFKARDLDYVRAARALGVTNAMMIWRHVLPNAMVATITFMPFLLTGAIETLTSLDFLGFGLPSGAASLGELVQQGKSNLEAPWLGISAFVVLSLTLTLLVFIGEGLRDAFDPRLNRG